MFEYHKEQLKQLNTPNDWKTEKEYLNGNGKLVAEYRNTQTDEKITVTPHKTYEIAGFANAHRVEYWENEETWQTVEKGLENCEEPAEAKTVAFDKISELAA